MPETTQEKNKALLLEGFNVLFNQRNYEAAKRYWSPHSVGEGSIAISFVHQLLRE